MENAPEPIADADLDTATNFGITDTDIERGRELLGVDLPVEDREYIRTLSHDSIRNFSYGCGNDNPLHCDPQYAASTRWGGVVAPAMMAGIVNTPMRGDPLSAGIKARTRGLFRGVHVFVSGSTWHWYRPIYSGDTLFTFRGEHSLEVKQSEFAGRSVIRVRREVKVNQRSEVVAVYELLRILTERKKAREKGKYSAIKPAVYTEADIADIDRIYAAEEVRGASPRYWDDVAIGDSLGKMAKGPLTITDMMCFAAGGYGFGTYNPSAARLGYKNRQRIPTFYVKNAFGVPDVAQRLHWDDAWAQAIGNPMAYDYGVMRENYLYHYLSDWCGDDSIVLRVHDEIRKFNYVGDTQTILGEVTGKREENGHHAVDVTVRFTNQRGEETLRADATIALPSRTAGLPLYPQVPVELQQRAAAMMRRHWALSAGHP